jgi:hypothetical protein
MGCDPNLGFMARPGHGFLSGLDTSGYDAGEAAGIPDSVLSYLDDIGATDQDVQYMADGEQTLTETLANYGSSPSSMPAQAQLDAANAGLIPAITSSAAQAAATSPSPSSSQTAALQAQAISAASGAQSPPGSTLSITASFPGLASLGTNLTASAAGAIAYLQQNLPAQHLSVQSSSSSTGVISNSSIQLTILDSIGHQYLSDITSIIQSLLQTYLGTPATVSISLLSSPTPSSGGGGTVTAPSAAATTFATWAENNALWIGLGLVALVAVPPLLKKL